MPQGNLGMDNINELKLNHDKMKMLWVELMCWVEEHNLFWTGFHSF